MTAPATPTNMLPHEHGSWDFVRAFVNPPHPATRGEVLTCNLVGLWWLVCGVVLMYQVCLLVSTVVII